MVLYELPIPTIGGDLGHFLESVEAVSLQSPASSRRDHENDEIETFVGGFASLEDTTHQPRGTSGGDVFLVVEPTPIDPKSMVVVDTFHSTHHCTQYIIDETHPTSSLTTSNFFDATILRGLRTLIDTSSSSSKVDLPAAAYRSGPLAAEEAPNAPKRDLDDRPVPNNNKRARISSARSEEVDGSTTTSTTSSTSRCCRTTTTSISDASTRLRSNHIVEQQWDMRFSELVEYKKQYGHCLVPINWPPNPSLAHWVKRQRYQYRIRHEEGKHSSLTPERLKALQELGFTWDSHSVAWLERWQELAEFKQSNGHANVPKTYPENSKLAVWVKCQRRQYKLYAVGQRSNMTPNRIERLNSLGFVFNPRSVNTKNVPRTATCTGSMLLRGYYGCGAWP